MYASLVLASWEWHLGEKDGASKRVAGIPIPDTAEEQRVYYGCLACFCASVGDEGKIADAIKKTLSIVPDKSFRPFIERDVVLDPYRGKDWFVKLAGTTLLRDATK